MNKRLHIAILSLCVLGVTSSCFAIDSPIKDFASRVTSNTMITMDDCNLIRIIKDLNNDNIEDIAISTNCSWGDHPGWGNAGGTWEIYLGQHGRKEFRFIGEIFFHALAINIKSKEKGISLITTYYKLGRSEGELKQYQLSFSGIKLINKNTITPGRSEEDTKQYDMLFGSLYKDPISEVCLLSQYLKNPDCKWQSGYYILKQKDD